MPSLRERKVVNYNENHSKSMVEINQSLEQGRVKEQEMKGQCKDLRPKRKLQTPLNSSREAAADIEEDDEEYGDRMGSVEFGDDAGGDRTGLKGNRNPTHRSKLQKNVDMDVITPPSSADAPDRVRGRSQHADSEDEGEDESDEEDSPKRRRKQMREHANKKQQHSQAKGGNIMQFVKLGVSNVSEVAGTPSSRSIKPMKGTRGRRAQSDDDSSDGDTRSKSRRHGRAPQPLAKSQEGVRRSGRNATQRARYISSDPEYECEEPLDGGDGARTESAVEDEVTKLVVSSLASAETLDASFSKFSFVNSKGSAKPKLETNQTKSAGSYKAGTGKCHKAGSKALSGKSSSNKTVAKKAAAAAATAAREGTRKSQRGGGAAVSLAEPGSSDDDLLESEEEESDGDPGSDNDPMDMDEKKVEKILGMRSGTEDGMDEFLVKFEDFSYREVQWLAGDKLQELCLPRLRAFLRKLDSGEISQEPDIPDCYTKVDRVVAEHGSGENRQYLVKWAGLGYAQATWEFEDANQDLESLPTNSDEEEYRTALQGAIAKFKKRCVPIPGRLGSSRSAYVGETPTFKGGRSLRDYQVESFKWMVSNHRQRISCMLGDEMGLGKTAQSVAVMEHIRLTQAYHQPFLVIAPLTTLGHWKREIEAWTDMNVVTYEGNAEDRETVRKYELFHKTTPRRAKFNVLLTSFEIARKDDLALLFERNRIPLAAMIVDEAHRLKGLNSQIWAAIQQFNYQWTLLLTGTPIQNNVQELFSLLHILDPVKWESWEEFSNIYCGGGDKPKTAEQAGMIKDLLKPLLLRRMKEDVETLPTKEEIIVWVELTKEQRNYYRALYDNKLDVLLKGTKNFPNMRNLAMELRKVCNHPFLCNGFEEDFVQKRTASGASLNPTDMLVASSGKMVLVDKLLTKLKAGGHKVLIFSQFKMMLDRLEDYLIGKKHSYERLDGSTAQLDRQAAIDRFNSNPDDFVFMLSTKAGGVGITLTSADTAIIFDSDWNPQNDLQAMARCHRIGQTNEVRVYRLITKGTYEQGLFETASRKYGLDEAILGGGSTDCSSDPEQDKKMIDNLLKFGAHAMKNEDGSMETGTEFCDESIDKILESHTETRAVGSRAGNTFSVATFTVNEEDASAASALEAAANLSWEELYGEEACAAALAATESINLVDGPRKRQKVDYTSGGGSLKKKDKAADDDSEDDQSGQPDNDSDNEQERKGKTKAPKEEKVKLWSEAEVTRVEHVITALGSEADIAQIMDAAQIRAIWTPEEVRELVAALAAHINLGGVDPPTPADASKHSPSSGAPLADLDPISSGSDVSATKSAQVPTQAATPLSSTEHSAQRLPTDVSGSAHIDSSLETCKKLEPSCPALANPTRVFEGLPVPEAAKKLFQSSKFLIRHFVGRTGKSKSERLCSRAALRLHLTQERAEGEEWQLPAVRAVPPTHGWGAAEDRALLLGSLKHGHTPGSAFEFGRQMDLIRNDPDLHFSRFQWRVPQADKDKIEPSEDNANVGNNEQNMNADVDPGATKPVGVEAGSAPDVEDEDFQSAEKAPIQTAPAVDSSIAGAVIDGATTAETKTVKPLKDWPTQQALKKHLTKLLSALQAGTFNLRRVRRSVTENRRPVISAAKDAEIRKKLKMLMFQQRQEAKNKESSKSASEPATHSPEPLPPEPANHGSDRVPEARSIRQLEDNETLWKDLDGGDEAFQIKPVGCSASSPSAKPASDFLQSKNAKTAASVQARCRDGVQDSEHNKSLSPCNSKPCEAKTLLGMESEDAEANTLATAQSDLTSQIASMKTCTLTEPKGASTEAGRRICAQLEVNTPAKKPMVNAFAALMKGQKAVKQKQEQKQQKNAVKKKQTSIGK